MNIRKFLTIPGVVLLAFAGLSGCSRAHDGKQPSQPSTLAEQEARRHGWGTVEVDNVRDETNQWVVEVWRVPRTSGGYAYVHISKDGKLISFVPGY